MISNECIQKIGIYNCSVGLLALQPLAPASSSAPPLPPPSTAALLAPSGTSSTGWVVGAAVGGALGGVLLVTLAAIFMFRWD